MTSTKRQLQRAAEHLTESLGERSAPDYVTLAPTAKPSDIGRRPAPEFGRIDIDKLRPDPTQPRTHFDQQAIEQLGASLQSAGQLAPIRVRWSDEESAWLIVAGERRWRAARHAGLKTVECYFYRGAIDQSETLRLQLVENLLRENLRPIEEARGFARLMEQQDCTGKQLAAELCVTESKISRSLALLRLPEDVQEQIEEGRLSPRAAYEITKAASQAEQRRLAKLASSGSLGVQELQKATIAKKKRRAQRRRGVRLTFPLENGWSVRVACNSAGNYHAVEHALLQALEEVRARINGGVQLF